MVCGSIRHWDYQKPAAVYFGLSGKQSIFIVALFCLDDGLHVSVQLAAKHVGYGYFHFLMAAIVTPVERR